MHAFRKKKLITQKKEKNHNLCFIAVKAEHKQFWEIKGLTIQNVRTIQLKSPILGHHHYMEENGN